MILLLLYLSSILGMFAADLVSWLVIILDSIATAFFFYLIVAGKSALAWLMTFLVQGLLAIYYYIEFLHPLF